jgi:hypothetical protein
LRNAQCQKKGKAYTLNKQTLAEIKKKKTAAAWELHADPHVPKLEVEHILSARLTPEFISRVLQAALSLRLLLLLLHHLSLGLGQLKLNAVSSGLPFLNLRSQFGQLLLQ